MFDKTSYEQIPIPADVSAAYRRAKRRWRVRREHRLMAMAACAAFVVGFSVPIGMHLASQGAEAPLDADPVSNQETTIGYLPLYQGNDIQTLPAETEPNEALREAIAAYYEVPDDFLDMNRYYYNYVDLNGDGTDEVFAVGFGSYLSGSGGGSGLLLTQNEDGALSVLQNFTLINTPVIVCDGEDGAWRDLILPYSGGGAEPAYMRLTYGKNGYPNTSDGESLSSLEGVSGTSILYTDFTKPDAPWITLEP